MNTMYWLRAMAAEGIGSPVKESPLPLSWLMTLKRARRRAPHRRKTEARAAPHPVCTRL